MYKISIIVSIVSVMILSGCGIIRDSSQEIDSARTNKQESTTDSLSVAIKNNEPIFYLIERNPWKMVIGSDTPSFALYGDGTVIYLTKEDDNKYIYHTVTWEISRVHDFIDEHLASSNFDELNESYRLTTLSDQVENEIGVLFNGEFKKVRVYGNLNRSEFLEKIPKAFGDLYVYAKNYEDNDGDRWLPELIEVMIWPYDHSPEPPIKWPHHWPRISDPTTVNRGNGYSIFLDRSEYEMLKNLLENKKAKQAVLIENRKYAISVRLPFPYENKWQSSQ